MIVYFVRHASAGTHLSSPKKDEKRPLDKIGLEQSAQMGRALASMDVQVDLILSSPLKRAVQTASLVGNELGYEGSLLFEDGLRPNASYSDFRKMLQKHANKQMVMVVGHNPSLSQFLGKSICNKDCEASIDLKKGAAARVDIEQRSMLWCITPRVVKSLQSVTTTNSRPKSSRK
ncbi:MAG: histidine phosphatase family protein [Acidobacteriales bacterium]|nr:histidine phosphatase family protein [Terriglobales bacterium]